MVFLINILLYMNNLIFLGAFYKESE
ncbi:hypothetical protein XBP1_740004 [Xenorhabdus bovienii str. puntauvense]|uniref:Uncharacterized protein n=2 Tax=Xenorhabdus bovienii TaxID=40576 RepID=A0A0B6XFA9_XENBV|nr:hypothetical protein XBP1_740004 [Xenorhabdus bovienii str. puntauvense]CDM91901.1 protein of unknown function [Xenorhabdus bovienii]